MITPYYCIVYRSRNGATYTGAARPWNDTLAAVKRALASSSATVPIRVVRWVP